VRAIDASRKEAAAFAAAVETLTSEHRAADAQLNASRLAAQLQAEEEEASQQAGQARSQDARSAARAAAAQRAKAAAVGRGAAEGEALRVQLNAARAESAAKASVPPHPSQVGHTCAHALEHFFFLPSQHVVYALYRFVL
jgi:hypothetical protein